MKGMPSSAVISFSCPATSICSCSLSTTQGPAMRKKGLSRPTSKPQSFIGIPGEIQALDLEHRGHRGTTEERDSCAFVLVMTGTTLTKLVFLCGSSVSSVFKNGV